MPSKAAPSSLPVVKISRRGTRRLQDGHVWVYRSDIVSASGVAPGAAVGVTDERGKFLGTALYSSASQIAIRMISTHPVNDLPGLLRDRIAAAISYRERVVRDTDAYRVIFSEADFLAGLIVDRYNDLLSVQALTQAMDAEPVRNVIVAELNERLKPASIVERVDPRVRELEQLPARPSGLISSGAADEVQSRKTSTVFSMNGVRFHYEALEGQKTGAFLDQRENYAAAAGYAYGEALDVFCYQGGFALHLAQSCSQVTGVDSSRPALEVADRNAALNGREIEWVEANAFDLLRDYADAGRRYDTIILDPPAFAKSKSNLETALRGYKELNLRALKMLRPSGILVTCCCSYHVSPALYLDVVGDSARDVHRNLRIVENRGQAKDHPMLLNVPETGYLKCIIACVSN
ncbi:MAG TPA: class I SAM-dependent rRNA methyltransferase [Terriglobales bacterium]|jgi:23S rRNA (cytosine1962-C5)-methyltransferase|nr:class I SAM-dependent rRNA methyltransferase [Terriglobales bacterium]